MFATLASPAAARLKDLTVIAIGTCEGFATCATCPSFTWRSKEQFSFPDAQAIASPLSGFCDGYQVVEHWYLR